MVREERTDEALVTATLGGEIEAFSALVRRYERFAYGVAIGVISDFDLARDAAQDAFVCAFRKLAGLKDPTRFSAWLHSIVKRTAYGAVRRWVERDAGSLTRAHGAAWTLARTGAETTESALQALYRDGTPAVQAAALHVLAGRQGATMIGELRECLRGGRPRKVAHVAVKALRRLRPEADSVVRDMLNSPHWTERKAAVSILRRWGELTDAMRAAAATDPHPAVRGSAAASKLPLR